MADPPQSSSPERGTRKRSSGRSGCGRRIAWGALLLVLALVAAYAAAWVYRLLLATVGEYATPGDVGIVALIAAIALPLLLIAYGARLASAVHHALVRFGASAPVQALEWRFPRATAFLAERFARSRATGLGLTVGVVAAAPLVALLVALALQTATGSSIALVDLRVANLFAALREPGLDRAMTGISWLGSAPVVVAVAGVVAVLAQRAGSRADAVLVALALLAGLLFVAALAALTPPPPATAAPALPGPLLLPAGTVLSAACYGTVAYAGLHTLRRGWARDVLAVAAGLLIFAIGLARMYLGLEYTSAVIAGWAAGTLWLVLVVIVEDLWPQHSVRETDLHQARARRTGAVVAGVALLAVAAIVLVTAYAAVPPLPVAPSGRPVVIAPARVPSFAQDALPHYTITLFGARQEPITLILVGTQAQIEAAFHAAGWTEAERLSVGSLAHGIVSALDGHPDAAGPVTPSFVGVQPETLAFSQEVGGSFARRHHIRIWRTDVVTRAGQPVWLAEASFDQGFELSPRTLLPTHHIGANIDAERAYDVRSLRATGDVARTQFIQLVPPQHGHNAAGDTFFTSGQAVVVWLL